MAAYTAVWVCADGGPCEDVSALVDLKREIGVNYLTYPLFHPRLRRGDDLAAQRMGPKTRSDRLIQTKDWAESFIAKVSPWIDPDHPNQGCREASTRALMEELSRSCHLSMKTVILPPPRREPSNYASCLLRHGDLTATMSQQLLVTIPLMLPHSAHFDGVREEDGVESEAEWDGWFVWSALHAAVDMHTKVFAALEFTEELLGLSEAALEEVLLRWGSEPVKLMLLPTRLFITNDAGYPVLPKMLQSAVTFLVQRFVGVCITGQPLMASPQAPEGAPRSLLPYVQYIRHLQSRAEAALRPLERYIRPYYDVLQIPLQPLGDNLEAQTYETFEADPVKYRLYQQALTKALVDVLRRRALSQRLERRKQEPPGLAMQPVEEREDVRVVVYVVGAGRGPLVAAALAAANDINQTLCDPAHLPAVAALLPAAMRAFGLVLQIYALEKNPEAIITLRNRMITEQWGNVIILHQDMRHSQLPEKADVVVSELLGSFGDNELSPECLRGLFECHVRSFPVEASGASALDKLRGPALPISIPAQYSSLLQPVSAALPFMCARDLVASTMLPGWSTHTAPAARHASGLQTPYVAYLHRFCPLSAAPQVLWEFHHPPTSAREERDDCRYCEVRFTATLTATMHGFIGYFTSELYADVVMSIDPRTHSEDMASWFPIYLPLHTPVRVNKGQEISVQMWRLQDTHRMWYEWCLVSPQRSAIHNVQGRCYSVTL